MPTYHTDTSVAHGSARNGRKWRKSARTGAGARRFSGACSASFSTLADGLGDTAPPGLAPASFWRNGARAAGAPQRNKSPIPAAAEGGAAGDLQRARGRRRRRRRAPHPGGDRRRRRLDAGSLLRVSLAQNRKAIRTSSLHMGFSPTWCGSSASSAAAPLAHHLQETAAGASVPAPGQTTWTRGYCPFCGSWPAFIEVARADRGRAALFVLRAGVDAAVASMRLLWQRR